MTTAMRETPNLWVHAQEPSEWCGRPKHILLSQRGRKARKIPAMGRIFLLTFPFIELLRKRRVSSRTVCRRANLFPGQVRGPLWLYERRPAVASCAPLRGKRYRRLLWQTSRGSPNSVCSSIDCSTQPSRPLGQIQNPPVARARPISTDHLPTIKS